MQRRDRPEALRKSAKKSADPMDLHCVEVAFQTRARSLRVVRSCGHYLPSRDERSAHSATRTAEKGCNQWLPDRFNLSTISPAAVSHPPPNPPPIPTTCHDL